MFQVDYTAINEAMTEGLDSNKKTLIGRAGALFHECNTSMFDDEEDRKSDSSFNNLTF